MPPRPFAAAAVLLVLLAPNIGRGQNGSGTALPVDGDRVVFFGDSITQAGQYVIYVEAYLLTRFPDRRVTVINHGISSETISGTSEPDHTPRRPDAHDRYDRDVDAWHPDVLVACFGMNDGNYCPPDPDRSALYRSGVRRLIARAHATGARLDVLTPPPFDPYQRRNGDPAAEHYGYRYPAVNYDETLAGYARWLRTLRDEGFVVADVHTLTNEHLKARRRDRVSFRLAGDAVHPDRTGHWLMAESLLLEWGAPAEVATADVDAASGEVRSGEVNDVSTEDGTLTFTWRSPLPMPIDPAWDADSLRLERVAERLNRYRLRVTGLAEGRYRLIAAVEGGEPVVAATPTAEELADGVDLTAFPDFPTVAEAAEVLSSLEGLRSSQYQAWREAIRGEDDPNAPPPPGDDEATMEPIRQRCRPRVLSIRLEPAVDRR